nr:hypothetical protein [Tanacetum cinerariifolium]
MRFMSVVSVQVEKKSGYGYLEEIVVRRADQKLYKFKEGDFLDLHLNDIEDMLLLIAQNKLFNQEGDVTVDFVTALKMFSRIIIVQNKVKDVQLDKSKKKRLMCVDEIHKFCDGTLQSIRNILRERLLNFKFGYNKGMPSREWTSKDKRRTGIMLNKINAQLFKRRVLRSLEVLVEEKQRRTNECYRGMTTLADKAILSCADNRPPMLEKDIQSSSIKTPVKILHKVLHKLTINVIISVVIRLTVSSVDDVLIDDNYFSIDNIDYVEASPPDSELVSLEVVKDDNLHEKLLNINLLIAKIKSLNDNPTPDHVLKPPSPFPIPVEDSNSFLKKFNTSLSYSDNSLPKYETFINHMEETHSGSTATHADYSLPKYDSFLFEIEPDQGESTSVVILAEPQVHVPNVLTTHPTLMLDSDFIPSDSPLPESKIFYFNIKEKNSGSTTIHADISLLDLECFNFKREPNLGKLTSIVDFGIRENVLSATNVNLPPEDDHSPLFAYVVWIFLSFLTYLMVPLNLLSFRNEDTIFDPGMSIYHFSSFMPGVSHQSGIFMKFNVYSNHLNESSMEILSSTTFPKDQ